MLKEYRQVAIDSGEYHPVKRRGVRREGSKIWIHINKGDVQAQKTRARERREALKGTPQYERYLEQRRRQKQREKQRRQAREH